MYKLISQAHLLLLNCTVHRFSTSISQFQVSLRHSTEGRPQYLDLLRPLLGFWLLRPPQNHSAPKWLLGLASREKCRICRAVRCRQGLWGREARYYHFLLSAGRLPKSHLPSPGLPHISKSACLSTFIIHVVPS